MGDSKTERDLALTKFCILLRRNKYLYSHRTKQWYEIRFLTPIDNKCMLSKSLWISATNIKYSHLDEAEAYALDGTSYVKDTADWLIGGSGGYLSNFMVGEFEFYKELPLAVRVLYGQ